MHVGSSASTVSFRSYTETAWTARTVRSFPAKRVSTRAKRLAKGVQTPCTAAAVSFRDARGDQVAVEDIDENPRHVEQRPSDRVAASWSPGRIAFHKVFIQRRLNRLRRSFPSWTSAVRIRSPAMLPATTLPSPEQQAARAWTLLRRWRWHVPPARN